MRPGDERPDWIPAPAWAALSWRERDYILLERRGTSAEKIQRQLYFRSERTFRAFKKQLREKLRQL